MGTLRVVGDESSAKLKLYVATRRRFNTGDSAVVGSSTATGGGVSTGTGSALALEGYRVETILKIGDYESVLRRREQVPPERLRSVYRGGYCRLG